MSETDTDTRETSIVMVELQDAWFNARNCAIKAYAEAARAALAAIETDRLNVSDGRRAARVLAKAGTCETDRVATLQEGDKVAVTGTIELEDGTLRLKDAKFVAPKAAQEELLDAFVVPKHNEKGLRGAGFTPVKLGGSLNAAA